MDDVLYLIATSPGTRDENGVIREKDPDPRAVMCRIGSVTRAEFFAAGRAGLNPEYVAQVSAVDYFGETVARFHERSYAVYRTYLPEGSDYIELYLRREGGTNGR